MTALAKIAKSTRQNTQLEAAGAEFLVLGHLLIQGIAAYKTYTNQAGYDLIATNPTHHTVARIQVKSRWKTNDDGFIIQNFDCDFVVVALLNRGIKHRTHEIKAPEFFVFPVDELESLPRSSRWGKITFRRIPQFESYRNRWDYIEQFLAPAPTDEELEASYRAMAADTERENEALQWAEAMIGDAFDETR